MHLTQHLRIQKCSSRLYCDLLSPIGHPECPECLLESGDETLTLSLSCWLRLRNSCTANAWLPGSSRLFSASTACPKELLLSWRALPCRCPASCSSCSDLVQPFHWAARSSAGTQSSTLTFLSSCKWVNRRCSSPAWRSVAAVTLNWGLPCMLSASLWSDRSSCDCDESREVDPSPCSSFTLAFSLSPPPYPILVGRVLPPPTSYTSGMGKKFCWGSKL